MPTIAISTRPVLIGSRYGSARQQQQNVLTLRVLQTLAEPWLLPRHLQFTIANPGITVQFTQSVASDEATRPAPDGEFR